MNRREFLLSTAAIGLSSAHGNTGFSGSLFPPSVVANDTYVETVPVPEYQWAPSSSYEAFRDMKFGVRIHWGIYSIWHRGAESWPFLTMSLDDRQRYNELYKSWNPSAFDGDEWMDLFRDSGCKMFAITTKHHEGFSLFDTRTRVRRRADWTASGGPRIEDCDLAYSVMETPFRRDIIKELCDAAHKNGIKIDLYFSHPDWYDADFRPYVQHPLQVPDAAKLMIPVDVARTEQIFDGHPVLVPDPSPEAVARMMTRHRAQLVELLTNYGSIDMVGLDMYLGPEVWPELRKTILLLRKLQPQVMFRNRGIGNYGDYYTPERVVPGSKEDAAKPWFSIYPLGSDFSYEPESAKYKGARWIVKNIVDASAKGGGFMVGIGPSAQGQFHPEAARQMRAVGTWLKVNGEAIYATRAREGTLWSEGESIRFTRSKDNRFDYAITTVWPGRECRLASVRPKAGSAFRLLGYPEPLDWNFDAPAGTTSIQIPENLQSSAHRPCDYAWCFRIERAAVQAPI